MRQIFLQHLQSQKRENKSC